MPELWEQCNTQSKVILAFLYKQEHGRYPDWYLELSGKRKKPLVTVSPEVEEEYLTEVSREMSKAPSNREDGLDEG